MKLILKTLNEKYNLNYNETFNSAKNIKIRRKLIPEIRKSLASNYRPSFNQKKLRRIKAAKDLFNKKDSQITSYGKWNLLKILANRAYHLPEVSETEDEGSKSLRLLLRNVLDKHLRVGQTAQQLRPRNYDDEIQCYDKVLLDDAPNWSYIDKPDMVYDTEYTDDLNIDNEDLDAILEDKANKSESFMQEY
ncbi:unnamed protein product [Rhizophagus irregularis]|nr:unnamed protein product [Rhizophagus irregularis]